MTDVAAFERKVMRAVGEKLHETLVRATEAYIDIDEFFGDPHVVAEGMVAALPLSHVYDQICGPFHDTAGLTKWLGVSRQALHQKVAKHALLACPLADGANVYPAWQFLPNGATIPAFADVLAVLAGATDDPWMIALWLRAPSALLDGRHPSGWMRTGGDPQRVLELARERAENWQT